MSDTTLDDAALLTAWRDGDREAGRTLIGRHYDAIVRFFQTKAGPEADDLVQRTFLRCSERAQGDREIQAFKPYLFGIARHVLLEHIRRNVKAGRHADFDAISIADVNPGVATQADRRFESRMLVQALQLIPVESQLLLELYYWEDLDVAGLAEVLDIPTGTVKSRLHRARGQLREALDDVPELPDDPRSVRSMIVAWLDRKDED